MAAEHPERRPAVVAGASSGIGAETAKALATAGHPVALGARRVEACEELAAAIRAEGGEAVAHRLDVADSESVAEFSAKAAADLGDPEIVVYNAGRVGPGTLYEIDTDRFSSELNVNLVGAHRIVREFVPGLVERRRGDIVFVSSDVAVRARPHMAAYSASKWGLEGMASALQMELEGTGVRASVVRPGPTWSEMGADWDADEAAFVLNEWVRFGLARHGHFLRASAIAQAITTVVTAPRGVHLSLIDVNPEAPVQEGEA
ncbi:MAG TPA: SDR family oxidoreductase [Aeromicrobium sp.]|nr:SDR family oxidoreductase [Aeromicrobium sp.]HKY58912.1 SDR family oxidoreductase [Aeromicrobium sp.]